MCLSMAPLSQTATNTKAYFRLHLIPSLHLGTRLDTLTPLPSRDSGSGWHSPRNAGDENVLKISLKHPDHLSTCKLDGPDFGCHTRLGRLAPSKGALTVYSRSSAMG